MTHYSFVRQLVKLESDAAAARWNLGSQMDKKRGSWTNDIYDILQSQAFKFLLAVNLAISIVLRSEHHLICYFHGSLPDC